jgi:hypothetical protein
MPGTGSCYEHLGACFLNECDTAGRLAASACRNVAPGLDGVPQPPHDPKALNVCSRKPYAAADDHGKSLKSLKRCATKHFRTQLDRTTRQRSRDRYIEQAIKLSQTRFSRGRRGARGA